MLTIMVFITVLYVCQINVFFLSYWFPRCVLFHHFKRVLMCKYLNATAGIELAPHASQRDANFDVVY